MARIRSIHPGLWRDKTFVKVSPIARLLYIGILNECDDKGAFKWEPVELKMNVLPVDNVSVDDLLAELAAVDRIRMYEVDGQEYGAVRNFGKFQSPKKPNSLYPMPIEYRTYACTDKQSTEPDEDEGGGGTEPKPPKCRSGSVPKPVEEGTVLQKGELGHDKEDAVPKNSEFARQMEGRGKERKEEPPSLRSGGAARADDPPPSRQKRGLRLPADWEPSEADVAFAQSLGLRPQRIAAQFRDYWHAKAGADACKVDWSATWRNWCRREADGGGEGFATMPTPPPPKPKAGGQWAEQQRQIDELFGPDEPPLRAPPVWDGAKDFDLDVPPEDTQHVH